MGAFLTTRRKLDLDKHEALNGDTDNLNRSTFRVSMISMDHQHSLIQEPTDLQIYEDETLKIHPCAHMEHTF